MLARRKHNGQIDSFLEEENKCWKNGDYMFPSHAEDQDRSTYRMCRQRVGFQPGMLAARPLNTTLMHTMAL